MQNENENKNKIFLITGGTGSLGKAATKILLQRDDINEIRIFSRDEKKQSDMRKLYKNDKLKFYIGDIRDIASLNHAMTSVDFVLHASGMKLVPSCEFFPLEAVKTNIIGTDNVLTSAIGNSVKKVVCLSTDKANYPINAMGISKAMMEKVVIAKARTVSPQKTVLCCIRYGNVMASYGSVIPLFVEQLKRGEKLTVTDPRMTRFMASSEEAASLVIYAFDMGYQGDIFVQKSPGCNILDLAQAIKELFNAQNEIEIIGSRHGEKLYEILLTKDESLRRSDMAQYYRVSPDSRNLNYDSYLTIGDKDSLLSEEYNSDNADRLSIGQIKEKLLSLEYIQNELALWNFRG